MRKLVDVTILVRRNLVQIAREPLQLSDVTVQPVLFTLLFVYVFGAGVALPHGGSYAAFAIAGLLALNLATSSMGTAVGLSSDLATGVIERFRTLPMWKPAVLFGRSFADLLTAALCASIVASRASPSAGGRSAASSSPSRASASSCCSATPCRGVAPASASSARAPNPRRERGS
jgi:ABC-2 type transport system permease protein